MEGCIGDAQYLLVITTGLWLIALKHRPQLMNSASTPWYGIYSTCCFSYALSDSSLNKREVNYHVIMKARQDALIFSLTQQVCLLHRSPRTDPKVFTLTASTSGSWNSKWKLPMGFTSTYLFLRSGWADPRLFLIWKRSGKREKMHIDWFSALFWALHVPISFTFVIPIL